MGGLVDQRLRVPLTLAQEQLWAWQSLAPPGAFNEFVHMRFPPPVSSGALAGALAFLVKRHEVLRTAFPLAGGRPYQSIAPELTVEMPTTDLSQLTPPQAERELLDVMRAEAGRPFDPNVAPLFRARMVRLGDGSAEVVVVFDHLVTDMTSLEIFHTELRDAYVAFARGETPQLAPLDVQYADFAVWQRRWLTDERLGQQAAYWRQKLKATPPPMALPFDAAAPGATPSRGSPAGSLDLTTLSVTVEFTFAPSWSAALQRLVRACRTTSFVVMVAAVQALLARSGAGADVVMTTAFSGRDRAELEGVLGLFAGIGVLRTDLAADPPFEVIVQRTRETVLGLLKHGDVPLGRIVGDLARDGTTLYPAAVPVDVQFFRAARDRWRPGVSVVASPPGDGRGAPGLAEPSKPLALKFFDDGEQVWGRVNHHAHRFDRATVDRLVAALGALVSAAGEDPHLRLSKLPGIE